jgi:hypothetical protein
VLFEVTETLREHPHGVELNRLGEAMRCAALTPTARGAVDAPAEN